MSHPDPDDLALLALGESLGEPVDTHVADCAICQQEIESFQQTIGLADLSNYGENAPPVSEHVWQAITAELGIGDIAAVSGDRGNGAATAERSGFVPTQPSPVGHNVDRRDQPDVASTDAPVTSIADPNGGGDRPRPELLPPAGPTLRSVPTAADSTSVSSPAAPTSRTSADSPAVVGPGRRRSRWVAPIAAAVIGIALGAGAVAVLQNRSDPDTVEAVAPLTPVPTGPLAGQDGQQLGQADLVVSPTGPQVRVNAADLPAANSSAYEVWLFGNDGKMVSLGTLADGNGSFTVPPGISTQEYRVVDISDEPPDGNPAHSGVSLIRGEFS